MSKCTPALPPAAQPALPTCTATRQEIHICGMVTCCATRMRLNGLQERDMKCSAYRQLFVEGRAKG